MFTGARRRRMIRASRRAQVNPVKPLPTITMEVTDPSVSGLDPVVRALIGGAGMAAPNFYADRPRAFSEEVVEVGAVFATHIALAWSMMRRPDQFRGALASRDIIGQAKGVVMERFSLDAVEAFELLTRVSQKSNVWLVDIAAALIDSEHPLKGDRH